MVHHSDFLDIYIFMFSNEIRPYQSHADHCAEPRDPFHIPQMRVLDIESAGFQDLKHGLDSPSFLICREGFLRAAEGNEDLRFGLSGLVLDNGTGQIAEFSTDTIDTIQDAFLSMFEIGEDVLGPYISVGSWVFHPEVVADADMVLDSVVVEPFEPLITDKLTVRYQAFDTVTTEQADEPLHDIDSFLAIGVSPLLLY